MNSNFAKLKDWKRLGGSLAVSPTISTTYSGSLIGYGEILQEDPSRSCIDEVLRAGQRAASLTRQLLAFSRQQVLEPTILDLNNVVLDMEKMLRRLIGEDIELNTVLNRDLGKVKSTAAELQHQRYRFDFEAEAKDWIVQKA